MIKEDRTVFYLQSFTEIGDLELPDQQLIEAAKNRLHTAYAPYSKFNVCAALRLASGKHVFGTNQENVAYPSGICAERSALFNWGSNHSDDPIDLMVVVSEGELLEPFQVVTPCGACRQVMFETEMRQEQPIKVIVVSGMGRGFIFERVAGLLPFAFKELH